MYHLSESFNDPVAFLLTFFFRPFLSHTKYAKVSVEFIQKTTVPINGFVTAQSICHASVIFYTALRHNLSGVTGQKVTLRSKLVSPIFW